jgi:lipoprotein-releasing system permease protein
VIILCLMLAVAIVNMITALLVLVLERTNMIGILKSLGMRGWQLQQIFLFNAAAITLRGIFWGNLLGIGFCFLQAKFKFIRLNEADYYLSYAPVDLQWTSILIINLGTVFLTLLFLLVPSLAVARVSPLRAIQFK